MANVNKILKKYNESMASKVEGVKIKKKRMGWNEASEAALLDIWPSEMDRLRGHMKNGHIYAEMDDEIIQQGYSFSPRIIKVKLQNWELAAHLPNGHIMGIVHQIIGGFKVNLFAELALDSINDTSNSSKALHPVAPSSCSPSPEPIMSTQQYIILISF